MMRTRFASALVASVLLTTARLASPNCATDDPTAGSRLY
jgi:hypothetical protein